MTARQADVSLLERWYAERPSRRYVPSQGAPEDYQKRQYATAQKVALSTETRMVAPASTFGELLRTMEFAELEILRRTDHAREAVGQSFTSRDCKQARYHYKEHLQGIRRNMAVVLASVRKAVDLLPNIGTAAAALDLSVSRWIETAGDFPDGSLVAHAAMAGVSHVLSDDIDLVTFDGITLYTANYRAVQAARAANRLLVAKPAGPAR